MKEKKFEFDTPILFLPFTRMDSMKAVFAEIRKIKPKKFFIGADGPRNAEEKKKTDAVRKYILENIDWKCEVKTLFRDVNKGTKYGSYESVSWFFKHVDRGIVLEDDCLPSPDFFRFCQEILEKYKDDERVMHINGTNIEGVSDSDGSYFFTNIVGVWGWASWRRAWEKCDLEMKNYPKFDSYRGQKILGYRGFIFTLRALRLNRLLYAKKVEGYDYPWEFTCRINNALAIVPKSNLITNLGLGKAGGGGHTTNYGDDKRIKIRPLKFPLIHPEIMVNNWDYWDAFTHLYRVNIPKKLLELAIYKIKNLFKR
ncbi:MAG: nucleotide-diphospho-sugar transferase [Candidatus Pacearchaeota archaeon]